MYLRDISIESYRTVQLQEAQAIPSSENDGRMYVSHMLFMCLLTFKHPLVATIMFFGGQLPK